MTIRHVSDNNPEGTTLGQSTTDLISFHGVTATAQRVSITNTSGTLGDTNSRIGAIILALVCKGLIASA